MMHSRLSVALAAAFVLVAAGCGSSSSGSANSPQDAQAQDQDVPDGPVEADASALDSPAETASEDASQEDSAPIDSPDEAQQPDGSDADQPDAEQDAPEEPIEPQDAPITDTAPDQSDANDGFDAGRCHLITAPSLTVVGDNYLVSPVSPELGTPDEDRLTVELRPAEGQALQAGTYDLSAAPESNYASCEHCVAVFQDIPMADPPGKIFFQVEGTMQLEQLGPGQSGQSAGRLHHVRLVEVTLEQDGGAFGSVPVAGGECLFLVDAAWNTMQEPVEAGTGCEQAEQCGAVLISVCDPETHSCQPGQCTQPGDCPAERPVCLGQVQSPQVGACYAGCEPFVGGCEAGRSCEPTALDLRQGVCLSEGAAVPGASCEPSSDVSTGCQQDHGCHKEGAQAYCRQRCNYWASPQCPTGQSCDLTGRCSPIEPDQAAIDEQCNGAEGQYCASNQGLCYAESEGAEVNCRRLCRTNATDDCTQGECLAVLGQDSTVGLCFEVSTL